jgi:hypothetical protein
MFLYFPPPLAIVIAEDGRDARRQVQSRRANPQPAKTHETAVMSLLPDHTSGVYNYSNSRSTAEPTHDLKL